MLFRKFTIFLLCFINMLLGPVACKQKAKEINKDKSLTYVYDVKEIPIIIQKKEEPIKTSKVQIFAAGDFMLHGPQLSGAEQGDGTYNFDEYFKYLPHFKNADMAMINYETTVSVDGKLTTYPMFSSPEDSIKALKNQGFDVICTANNHAFDKGFAGVNKTIDTIKKYEMDNIGTYKDNNNMPLIKEVNGIKFGISAYTYSINGFEKKVQGTDKAYAINFIDMDKIKKDIAYMNENDVDVKLVYMHWGNEYQRKPHQSQIKVANELNALGVDLILGSHPHVIQKSDIIEAHGKKTYVCYSMGNFVSNQRREGMGQRYSESELMMEVIVKKDKDGVSIEKFEAHPLWVDKYRANGKSHYNVIPVKDALDGKIKVDRFNQIKAKLLESLNDFNELYK